MALSPPRYEDLQSTRDMLQAHGGTEKVKGIMKQRLDLDYEGDLSVLNHGKDCDLSMRLLEKIFGFLGSVRL